MAACERRRVSDTSSAAKLRLRSGSRDSALVRAGDLGTDRWRRADLRVDGEHQRGVCHVRRPCRVLPGVVAGRHARTLILRLPLPTRDHPARSLDVPALHPQLPRCRGAPGREGHCGHVREYPALLCSAGHGQALFGCPTPRFDCPAGSRFSPESAQMALPRWGQKNEVDQSGPRSLAAMRREGQAPDADSLHSSSREGQISALARIRLCSSPCCW